MEEVEKLIRIMTNQLKLYRELEKVCKRQEKVIIEGELRELEKIVREQEKIFAQMKIWEEIKTKAIACIKKKLALPENLPFGKMLEALKKHSCYFDIENLHKKIVSKIEDIRKINARNIYLLEYSLKIVDEYFQKLTRATSTSSYTRKGKSSFKDQASKLLDKIT